MTTSPARLDFSADNVESLWLNDRPAPQRLLVAFPHPDDESFGCAGTLARYAAAGVAVHYACGTRGEAGTVSPEHLGEYADAGALRTAEVTCAAQALNLAAVHFMNYRDSGMAGSAENAHPDCLVQAPLEDVTRKLVAFVRALRPQVVITFAPYGGYGHPDHIKTHHAMTAAFHAAGDPARFPEQLAAGLAPWQPQKLYYPTFGTGLIRIMIGVTRLLGRDPRRQGTHQDIDFVEAAAQATPVTTKLDTGPYVAQKLRAWQCHRSQISSMDGLLRMPRLLQRAWLASEQYTRAVPAWQPGERREVDLFAGVRADRPA